MKNSNVINSTAAAKSTIEPYRFKVLTSQPPAAAPVEPMRAVGFDEEEDEEFLAESEMDNPQLPQTPQTPQSPQAPSATLNAAKTAASLATPANDSQQSSFIEELLKRTDDLSGNIIKLQMQIESQENEFKERLASEVDRAKNDGIKEGEEAAKADFNAKLAELQNKFTSSIERLNTASSQLEKLYSTSQAEIAATAVEIAKEVVLKEVKDSSSIIASNIAKSLINELTDATKIELKINPADFEFVSSNIPQKSGLSIVADDAISTGGVVVHSDIGNIDGSVMARFEKIKKILQD